MSEPRFKARVTELHGAALITLTGDINALAESDLDDATSAALGMRRDILVLDFEPTRYINSTGIALIVSLIRRAHAARVRVIACGLSDHYREIFSVTRLTDYMAIADDVADAVRAPTMFLAKEARGA